MRRVVLFVVAAVAVLAVSGASGSAGSGQARWVITDLGTLGGRDSGANAINASGQVVGWSGVKGLGPSVHAFLWQKGKMIDLESGADPGDGVPGWGARAINDRGEIVGSDAGQRAFLWRNGKLTHLGSLPGLSSPPDYEPAHSYMALAINERSQIIGMTYPQSSQDPGLTSFIWQNGKMTRIDGWVGYNAAGFMGSGQSALNENGEVVGGGGYPTRPFVWKQGRLANLRFDGYAAAVNDRGQVVGTSLHGFLWEKGKLTDLGTLPGDAASYAIAINEHGQVAGSSGGQGVGQSGYRPDRAFLWEDGHMKQVGPKGRESFAWAMNDNGQVIGNCRPLNSPNRTRAFVWDGTEATVLPTLGGGLSDALAVNNNGQVVGWATTKSGQKHAVLWTLRSG
jgi:probable HAF family extracellular repeat protein